jgi:Gluconate 2-dehydrogenase subunit 3
VAIEYLLEDSRMFTRREFLSRAMPLALLPTALKAFARQRTPSHAACCGFSSNELDTLVAAMEEIIPAGDGMPAASTAGGPDYLQYLGWQYPAIQEEIRRFLDMLAQSSAASFRDQFPKLRPEQRVQVLAALEKNQAMMFLSFVGYVYESYYTSPKVVGLISCQPSPFSLEDQQVLLAPVRKMTRLYREVR